MQMINNKVTQSLNYFILVPCSFKKQIKIPSPSRSRSHNKEENKQSKKMRVKERKCLHVRKKKKNWATVFYLFVKTKITRDWEYFYVECWSLNQSLKFNPSRNQTLPWILP